MTNIIDGKAFAANLRVKIAEEIKSSNLTPGLAVVLVGDDPASHVYVRNKDKAASEVGIEAQTIKLPATTTQEELLAEVERLNNDAKVHGILVQLPLPDGLDDKAVINAISPEKDVDGFHVINTGRAVTGQDALVPCTPYGCILMLKDVLGDLSGLNAVVIGRSNIVGKPMANLLLNENCTVTIAHSRTKNLPEVCAEADILVAAVGREKMVKAEWVKDGATVIDVGINRGADGKLCGDVDFADVQEKCKAITPVPGGVGPMTIACLLQNVLKCAKNAS